MAHLIHIGNSIGLRIPKAVIAQAGFKEDTNLEFKVTSKGLLISPIRHEREGWTERFEETQKCQESDLLLGENIINQFDNEEWEW